MRIRITNWNDGNNLETNEQNAHREKAATKTITTTINEAARAGKRAKPSSRWIERIEFEFYPINIYILCHNFFFFWGKTQKTAIYLSK